jgi:hypothetical protein
MSLKTQKPSPLSLNAWWVPPAICAAHLAVVSRAEDVVRGGDGASGGRQRARDLRRVHHGETDGSAFFFSQRAPEDSRDVALLVHGEDVDEARFLLGDDVWVDDDVGQRLG